MVQRQKFSSEFKARIVLEMITEHKSAAHISREYKIKDSLISRWKQEPTKCSPSLFANRASGPDEREQRIAELECMIGQLVLELEA